MPLRRGASNATRQANIEEMIAAGHDPRQSVAAAYREQRAAKPPSRRRTMSESAMHAPGHDIGKEDGAIRQRQRMGQGGGAMAGETFGVGPLPGTHITHNQGEHMPHDGVHLHDQDRAGPPPLYQGDDQMHATAHSHHGPHTHSQVHHHQVPKGTRPHHIGGAAHTGGKPRAGRGK
jgi:hypothetical protein